MKSSQLSQPRPQTRERVLHDEQSCLADTQMTIGTGVGPLSPAQI